jgi:hypothetical protein
MNSFANNEIDFLFTLFIDETPIELHPYVAEDAQTCPKLQCKYRSKSCNNQRALKSDGKLHSLCQAHREKQGISQTRWLKRKVGNKRGVDKHSSLSSKRAKTEFVFNL